MLSGWLFITSALLIVSGGAKIADRAPTAGALAAAGLPARPWMVPLLGAGEIAAGTAALSGSVAGMLAHALLYLGFAAFVGLALIRHLPIQSCGCFGRPDTPPSATHVFINLSATATGPAMGFQPLGLPAVLADQPGFGLPYLGFLGIGTYLTILALTELPTSMRLVRS